MPNTVHGPYTGVTCINGVTPMNATLGNLIQTQSSIALAGFNPDLLTAFVEQGIIASPDAATANQLDVTAGRAYVTMSDGTVALIVVVSSTQTTSTINATYNLYLQPDGTWYWSTSNSPQANSLFIATVTTNGSGNISGVTDKRPLAPSLLPGAVQGAGVAALGTLAANSPQPGANPGTVIGGVTAGQPGGIAGDSSTSMQFDGTTGYIPISGSGFPSANAAWSLEAIFNATALPGSFATAVAFGAWGTTRGAPNLSIDSAGHVIAGTFSGDAASATTITANTWHHLVGTWDSTTLRCYLDGTQVATATPGALVVPASPSCVIGGDTASPVAQMWKGYLSDVAIYSATLSAGQVTAHYTAFRSGSATTTYARTVLGDSPLRYYRLGDAATRGARQAIAATAPVVAADGSISPTSVAQVADQATTGPYGVPLNVGQTLPPVHVTGTLAVNVLQIVAPATGLYRVSGTFTLNNGTSGQKIDVDVAYHDGNSGASVDVFMSGVAGAYTVFSGSGMAGTVTNQTVPLTPIDIYAKGGQLIQCFYQDLGGTPSDFVCFVIERLG